MSLFCLSFPLANLLLLGLDELSGMTNKQVSRLKWVAIYIKRFVYDEIGPILKICPIFNPTIPQKASFVCHSLSRISYCSA